MWRLQEKSIHRERVCTVWTNESILTIPSAYMSLCLLLLGDEPPRSSRLNSSSGALRTNRSNQVYCDITPIHTIHRSVPPPALVVSEKRREHSDKIEWSKSLSLSIPSCETRILAYAGRVRIADRGVRVLTAFRSPCTMSLLWRYRKPFTT